MEESNNEPRLDSSAAHRLADSVDAEDDAELEDSCRDETRGEEERGDRVK